jgi:radical SAM protein with 4Fe4S-binding SPASM domain
MKGMARLNLSMEKTKGIKIFLKNYPRIFNFVKRIYRDFRICKRTFLKGDLNFCRCYLSARLKTKRSLGRPIHLTLEITNSCNLKCPICETGNGSLNRTPKMMTLEEFRQILSQFDNNLKYLLLYFMGESFLNKEIYEMIKYAAAAIGLYVSVCTNGEVLEPARLVKSGIAEIQFQIAGITQEAHRTYRVNGNLDRTLSNLKEVIKLKRLFWNEIKQEKFPLRVNLGFILMKHNEYQIGDFINLAKELGVDKYNVIDTCARNIEQARRFLPNDKTHWIYDPLALESGKLKVRFPPDNYCEWIYSTVTIQVNGDVVPCCRDPLGKYVLGNVFKENIYEIWNNKKFQEVRAMVTQKQADFDLCKLCQGYALSLG